MNSKRISANVRALRRFIGESLRTAGKPVDAGDSMVCRWETGNRPLHSRRARQYARLVREKAAVRLGVSFNPQADGPELDAEIGRLAAIIRGRTRRVAGRLERIQHKIAGAAALLSDPTE